MSNIFLKKSNKVQPSGRFSGLPSGDKSPPKTTRWSKELSDIPDKKTSRWEGGDKGTDSSDNDYSSNNEYSSNNDYSSDKPSKPPPKTNRWGAIQNELADEREREEEQEDERQERGNRFLKREKEQDMNGNYHRRQTFNYSKKTKIEPPKLFDLEKEEGSNSFPALG
jgi:hypothetical protein